MDYFSSILSRTGKMLSQKRAPAGFAGARPLEPVHMRLTHTKKLLSDIPEKASWKIGQEKLAKLEEKIALLMEKQGAYESDIRKKLGEAHTRSALETAEKIPDFKEIERKADEQLAMLGPNEAAAEKKTGAGAILERLTGTENAARQLAKSPAQSEKQAEQVEELAQEAMQLRLVTDFDRVLNYIREHGKASYEEISRDLWIPIKRIDECCSILRDERQAEIVYPPFGSPYAQSIGYAGQMRKEAKGAKQGAGR